MNSMEFKAGLVCVVAFVVGLLVAGSGCSNRSRVIGIQSPIDGVYTVVQPPVVTLGEVEKIYEKR
tara:strand:+ start:1679 stop:1873 length:195 start_codon:yes stop_codon:yes gene_type:complete